MLSVWLLNIMSDMERMEKDCLYILFQLKNYRVSNEASSTKNKTNKGDGTSCSR